MKVEECIVSKGDHMKEKLLTCSITKLIFVQNYVKFPMLLY